MRILVTGATGFVGKNLVERLLKEKHQLVVTSSGNENGLPEEMYNSKDHMILYYRLGGMNWDRLEHIDAVFHQAANNDTRCKDEQQIIEANVNDSVSLFKHAFRMGCRDFIYASSTAVYGNQPSPYIEGKTAEVPLNSYAISKLALDRYMYELSLHCPDVKIVGLRYCNVYGPGEAHKGKRMSMIGQLFNTIMRSQRPKLFKDGEQKRDWVYVDDVVEANMAALKSKEGGIYNIGSGVATSFNDLVNMITDIVQSGDQIVNSWRDNILPPEYIDCPFSDEYQNHTCCDIEKAKSHLGWEPKCDLATGLSLYFEHLSKAWC